ncbi:MAG: hypothetical protein HQL12_05000 [Candidatus Omnitrophica bacterium]|nr:hypothetical protein [Candidatus Omnitrophota bacterium]
MSRSDRYLKAFAIVEFVVLFVIIISAFLIMRNYIQRGIYGKLAKTGQSFAYGRQFDPQKTIECGFDPQSNTWFDRNCFEYYKVNNKCNGNPDCEESIINGSLCSSSGCIQTSN